LALSLDRDADVILSLDRELESHRQNVGGQRTILSDRELVEWTDEPATKSNESSLQEIPLEHVVKGLEELGTDLVFDCRLRAGISDRHCLVID
jgi:hypothetical protein